MSYLKMNIKLNQKCNKINDFYFYAFSSRESMKKWVEFVIAGEKKGKGERKEILHFLFVFCLINALFFYRKN